MATTDPNVFDAATFERSATGYVVTAPYVTLTTATPHGRRLVGLHAGAPVPDDVTDQQVFYHLRDGMIEELPAPEPPAPEPPADPEPPVKAPEADTAVKAPEAAPAAAEAAPEADTAPAVPAAAKATRAAASRTGKA